MKRIRLRERKLKRRKEKWLKKAAAALCSAALLVGLAEGADSLSVRAAGDTKEMLVGYDFLCDKNYAEDARKAANAFMDANDMTLTDSYTGTIYTSTNKHCDDSALESSRYVMLRYTFTVPQNIKNFTYKCSDENIEHQQFNQESHILNLSSQRYGCYFLDGDNLLSSQYLLRDQMVKKQPDPYKSGYVFKGWVTAKDGDQSFDFNQKIRGVTKIYASWQDWSIDSTGNLTISSQDGMNDWSTNGVASNADKVKSVVVHPSITEIPADAFRNCTDLENVYVLGTAPRIGNTTFDDCKFIRDGKRGIRVPAGGADTYKTEWPGYACYITESSAAEDAHDYGSDWESDDKEHWRECAACGIKTDSAAHTEDGGTVTQQPTETQEGVMTYRCSVCAYEMRTEAIPVITPSADIDKEVRTVGEVPRTDVVTSAETLGEAALTEEEMEKAENGAAVTIRVTVKNADDSVSDEDKELIDARLDGYKVGKYLDISMLKKIGADEIQVVKMPNGSVQLVFQVPDNLKNTDPTKVRKFKVIRVHDGTAKALEDMDDNENTVTIETDRFSTYALAYQDVERTDTDDNNTPGDDNNNNNNNTPPGNTNTGGSTNTGNNTGGSTNTGNTNTRTAAGGTTGTGTNPAAGSTAAGTTGTAGTTNTGISNQTRGNALRTGDIAPVGFYTMIALCFLGIMIVLERKQQLNGIRLVRRMPRPY